MWTVWRSQSCTVALANLIRSLLIVDIACGLLSSAQESSKKPAFQEKGFWDNLYRKTNASENDWFQQWRDPSISRKGGQNLADVIMPYFTALGSSCSLRLLHIGCGTSSMPFQMLSDGFMNQVCIDVSEVAMSDIAIKFARLQNHSYGDYTNTLPCSNTPSVQFLARDAADTGFESSTFDIIIDKGTLDAQIGGPNSTAEVADTLEEAVRLLRFNGLYVQISHSAERVPILDKGSDGTPRPWHIEPAGATEPFAVAAPIAYVKSSTATASATERRKKDTTYVYIYRRRKTPGEEL